MTRFSDLLMTNEVHSAYEDVTITTSVEDLVNTPKPDFSSMSKLELESFGRTIGIELDRRFSKNKLIKQLQEHIEYMDTM